jgi:Lrp/AsnC family leucine-responsive transcriptional regulator
MTFHSEDPSDPQLDETDWRILKELQGDARLSYAQLARRVHLSGPSVAERVRRLERQGVITGYHARIDPNRVGGGIVAFVELRCEPARCLLRHTEASDYPEIVEVHKLTGDYCAMLRVRSGSMEDLEGLLEQLGEHGSTRASVVLSTPYQGRPVEQLNPGAGSRNTTRSPGWRQT